MIPGAGRRPFGVMIARGDLDAEIVSSGCEMQEEILWICEAPRCLPSGHPGAGGLV